MVPLDGKVALVTGASRGIGRAVAERLAQDGATVVVNYARNADAAREVVSAIEAMGGKATTIQADVSRVEDIRRLFRETVERFGHLDILINNAGTAIYKPLVEATEEDFDKTFALNARGTFFAMQEAARLMDDGGRMVSLSTGGTVTGAPGASFYAASKAAVKQFTKALAGRFMLTADSLHRGRSIPTYSL
jgi:3-oxoacyl-[acyl-carrier protein] reductase